MTLMPADSAGGAEPHGRSSDAFERTPLRRERSALSDVTVHPGDTLWSIAAAHGPGGDVQELIDRITAINHLHGATLQPGQHLRIPQ